jgi:hypothetical protein
VPVLNQPNYRKPQIVRIGSSHPYWPPAQYGA